ncbi:hypothetical protein ABMV07_04295 [Corynebacterium belfantii]|uniref:hypothetical protein n=1 Tax=Corynebacterium belfantii TaxID=2014537 RepID=UPI0035A926CB
MDGETPAATTPIGVGEGNAPTNTQEVQQGETGKQEMTVEDYQLALRKANAEAAKYRTQRNELRADAEKYRELQEAEKTELQKLTEAKETSDARAAEAERQLKLVNVLREYGISDDNIDLLGDAPEKFDERAQRLQALQAEAARRSGPPSEVPIVGLKPGASDPKQEPDNSYPTSWPVVGQFTQ